MSKQVFCYFPANAPADAFHYLDHLLPLAIELGLPVISRSEKQSTLISHFYPMAQLKLISPNEPLSCLQDPSIVISNAFRHQLEADLLYERMLYGSYESVYCPHGLSDKELLYGQFQELEDDRKVLLYGKKMEQEIPPHCTPFILGNYRKHHFEQHRSHYLLILDPYLQKLKNNKTTILWTPSWVFKGIEGISLDLLSLLLENTLLSPLPENIQVIFKPHPYLLHQIPETLDKIKQRATLSSNLVYLEEMPYIYPLFEKVDAYLGDTSSVGYDFLSTGKPIFSLTKTLDSPWQQLALEAPLRDGFIDWHPFLELVGQWNPEKTLPLLEEGFSRLGPLKAYKDSFYEFLEK